MRGVFGIPPYLQQGVLGFKQGVLSLLAYWRICLGRIRLLLPWLLPASVLALGAPKMSWRCRHTCGSTLPWTAGHWHCWHAMQTRGSRCPRSWLGSWQASAPSRQRWNCSSRCVDDALADCWLELCAVAVAATTRLLEAAQRMLAAPAGAAVPC
eukprot:GHRQ01015580.1.p1 GENE.GHRQ01015580.1~~GHRQ01015580.1.p1  ORF type:complete len:154 (-),score=23.66 GHRQ01015580.1:1078-1539(-)